MTIKDSTVSGNVATGVRSGATFTAGRGGGIYNLSTLTIVDTQLTQDTAGNGGGLYNDSGAKVVATGLTATSNGANSGNGGGIYDRRGALTIKGVTLSDNVATATGSSPAASAAPSSCPGAR